MVCITAQAIYRKTVGLGLKQKIERCQVVRLAVKMVIALPLLPPQQIAAGLAAIEELVAHLEDELVDALLNYVAR